MATGDSSIILQPGEGKALSAMGVQMTFKAVSEDTGGSFAFFEYTAPPGFGGPPPHIHRRMIEVFYILEGELTLQLGRTHGQSDALHIRISIPRHHPHLLECGKYACQVSDPRFTWRV